MKKVINVLSVALLLAGILPFSPAKAARVEMQNNVPNQGNFDVGPTSFSIDASPGETIVKQLQLTNRKGEDWEFSISVEDFQGSVSDPNTTVLLQGDKSGKYSAKTWITPELDKFTLKHGEREFFNVTITVPPRRGSGRSLCQRPGQRSAARRYSKSRIREAHRA